MAWREVRPHWKARSHISNYESALPGQCGCEVSAAAGLSIYTERVIASASICAGFDSLCRETFMAKATTKTTKLTAKKKANAAVAASIRID
jgi:hypothetical protein